jgi:hypothetical protein
LQHFATIPGGLAAAFEGGRTYGVGIVRTELKINPITLTEVFRRLG